jgi:hypothetical protein
MWGDKLASMMSWDWLQQGRSLQVPVESGKVSLDFYFLFFSFLLVLLVWPSPFAETTRLPCSPRIGCGGCPA